MRQKFTLSLFFLLIGLFSGAAWGQIASPETQGGEVSARLVFATMGVSDAPMALGLEIKLAPHWKTYWRSPGAAGLPATIDWTGSRNLKAAAIRWPAPQRFSTGGLETFGYTDHVILPIDIAVDDPAAALHIEALVEMMACDELCVPYTFNLTLDLPVQTGPGFYAGDIALWKSRVPGDGVAAGLDITHAKLVGDELQVTVRADPPLIKPDLLVEAPDAPLFAAPVMAAPDLLKLQLASGGPPPRPGTSLTFTLLDGQRSLEKTLPLGDGLIAPLAGQTGLAYLTHLLGMIMAAVLGGLILNLMPCVLPVLSLKLFSLMQHAGAPPRHVRLSFLASAAGIISSFLALAITLIALKGAGLQVGWGMQFQEPWFLIFMIALLAFFAATLWDFVHIPLPRFLADAINDRLPRPGEADSTLLGNFLTGAFATLLATPCSAPFVGTAIGFALAGSAFEILIIFFSLGIGLALPYLAVAAFPRVARHMPRPGRWMGTLRTVLGFALLGTALWLLNVLQAEWDPRSASLTGGAMLCALFVLWIRQCIRSPRLLVKGGIAIALALTAAFTLPDLLQGRKSDIPWRAFDAADIPKLVAAGKTVFVDVTADWCITCKVNARVLHRPGMVALLTAPDTIAMQADWTRRDPAIHRYLSGFKRYGIPFNAVYGPAVPTGLTLPEILTESAIIGSLDKAGGAP